MGVFKHIVSSKATKKKIAKEAQKSVETKPVNVDKEMQAKQGDWRIVVHKDELNGVWVAKPEHYWGMSRGSYRNGWRDEIPRGPFDYSSYSTPQRLPAHFHKDKDVAYANAELEIKDKKELFQKKIEARNVARETKEIHVL